MKKNKEKNIEPTPKVVKPLNLQKTYEVYIKSYGNMDIINKEIEELDLNLDTYAEIILNYIKYNISRSNYAKFFDHLDLINPNDQKSIVTYCSNSNIKIRDMLDNLDSYILMYRPDMLFNQERASFLRKKLNIYQDYLNSLNQRSVYTTSISYFKQIFQVFMESNFSMLRFCYQYRILTSQFNTYLKKIEKEDTVLYNEIIANISLKEQIKDETIEQDVYEILEKIKELGNDFSIIDFYSLTNYSCNEIIQKADQILNIQDKKLLRFYVSSYKPIKVYTDNEINRLLQEKIIFNIDNNLIEIPDDIKEEIINNLTSCNVPITTSSFHDACFRYYRGKLAKSLHL